jgi:hypothetical protein
MPKTKIQVSIGPEVRGYMSALIRENPDASVEELVAYAKAHNVDLKSNLVYNIRSVDQKKMRRKTSKKVSSTAIVKEAPTAVIKVETKPAVVTKNSDHAHSEKAMARLILQLGTIKARELIDRTEATFTQNLGL